MRSEIGNELRTGPAPGIFQTTGTNKQKLFHNERDGGMKETDLVINYPDGRSVGVRIMADGPVEVVEVKEASGPNDSWGAPYTCVNDEKVRKPGGKRAFRTWPEYMYGSPEEALPKRRPQGRHFAKGRPQFVQGAPWNQKEERR